MGQTHTPRARFLKSFEPEAAKTKHVLRAMPTASADFRPHDRSQTAMQLGWTFVMEQYMLLQALRNELRLGGSRPDKPDSWDGMLAAIDKQLDDVIAELRSPDNPNLEGSVEFYVGPKQKGQIPLDEFVEFMLHDQIHHRGQMSVYIRMAGGKVPAIYGPSADEPWT